jgi:hypothetical protein
MHAPPAQALKLPRPAPPRPAQAWGAQEVEALRAAVDSVLKEHGRIVWAKVVQLEVFSCNSGFRNETFSPQGFRVLYPSLRSEVWF